MYLLPPLVFEVLHSCVVGTSDKELRVDWGSVPHHDGKTAKPARVCWLRASGVAHTKHVHVPSGNCTDRPRKKTMHFHLKLFASVKTVFV